MRIPGDLAYPRRRAAPCPDTADVPGATIGAVCAAHNISEGAFYRWRKRYGDLQVSEVRRLRELESENARLKRLPAERVLEIDTIREVLRRK